MPQYPGGVAGDDAPQPLNVKTVHKCTKIAMGKVVYLEGNGQFNANKRSFDLH
jgi:hypothetical protein